MHFSIPVPHPLARLTRVIAALEQGRNGGDPQQAFDQNTLLVPHDNSRRADPSDYSHDLESLSLSRADPAPARRCDDLEFLSLSKVEGTGPDRHDSLSDLSLERSFPPRPWP
jgi:hypothetical protein